jgi:hypothetical protein
MDPDPDPTPLRVRSDTDPDRPPLRVRLHPAGSGSLSRRFLGPSPVPTRSTGRGLATLSPRGGEIVPQALMEEDAGTTFGWCPFFPCRASLVDTRFSRRSVGIPTQPRRKRARPHPRIRTPICPGSQHTQQPAAMCGAHGSGGWGPGTCTTTWPGTGPCASSPGSHGERARNLADAPPGEVAPPRVASDLDFEESAPPPAAKGRPLLVALPGGCGPRIMGIRGAPASSSGMPWEHDPAEE